MADYVSLQQPPSKRIRLTGNASESDFDFKMMSPFGTPDMNSNVDSFDPGSDFTDPTDNTKNNPQQLNPVPNHYQMQVNYQATANGPMSMYQNPQSMITVSNPNSTRQVNGTPQTMMYQQQQINPTAPQMHFRPTTTQHQNTSSTLIQGNYTPPGMVPVPNVAQTNIVKASDPNNNHVFVNSAPTGNQQSMQQHQQGTVISLPNQHTVMQTNKPTGLSSLNTQQFNMYQTQRPQVANSFHAYNVRAPMIDQTTTNSSTYQMRPQLQQVSPMPGSHIVTPTSVSNKSTTNSTGGTAGLQSSDIQRKQFIQRQLVLLLHSHKCQQREKQLSANGDSTRSNPCTLPHCATMKNVLQHMARCNDHKHCPVPHCVTSRQIILHWKQCANTECPICQPLKSSPASNNLTASIVPVTKDWQRCVTQDMRNHLVQKIITALFPIGNDISMLRDKRIVNLSNYARRVESDTFDVATNQEEYFHKLAEKIYRIQKELQERREKKRSLDDQLSDNGVASSIGAYGGVERVATIDLMSGINGPPNRVAPSTDPMSKPVFQHEGFTVLPNPLVRTTSSSTTSNQPLMATPNMPSNDSLHSLLNNHDASISSTLSNGANRIGQAGFIMKIEATSPTTSAQMPVVSVKKEETSTLTADASSIALPKQPVYFSREELRRHLQPVIDEMLKQEESIPFQQPVDPVALNILDYPKIIKHPMDISTIQKKLDDGEYENPLKFSDDARLMFNNAWTYNRKTTRIYRMCTKLSEVFTAAFDQAAQRLGYCCGQQYVYLPQVMFCYGNQLCCQIPRDGSYYYYNNTDPSRFNLSGDKYTFCAKCFDSVKGETITVGDDPAQTLIRLPKNEFLTAKNDIQEPETTVDCNVCTRRWHQVCALHFDHIWPEGFVCPTCVKQYNIRRKDNRFIASRLITTTLAAHLEQRVNEFLRHEKGPIGRVTIRVLAASDKICEVKPRMKKYCGNQVPNSYPYRAKAIFAFQEVEGADVVLFGMYVQEYDGRAPAPNSRRVYISYLDSVHFFRPKHLRTDVYHEILIGYLDYVKKLGYLYAHIWACPPSEGDDYIFHCHPVDQRVPRAKRLQDWYKKMLDRALLERVIVEYKDVREDCLDNQVQNVWNIPYFEGDFWANIIEESIKELDQEEEDRRQQELESARAVDDINLDEPFETEDPSEISDKRRSTNTHKKKNLKKTASNQRKVAKKQMSNCTDLISKVFSTMEKHKEAFFVIRLQETGVSLPTINDNDVLIQCDLMDTRDAFLNFARDKHYEFSSIRRAKFSTLALLYEIHTAANEKFNYSCNTCRQQCEIRYHCTECEDYDLCEKCYSMEPKHKHKMERSTPGVVDDGDQSSSRGNGKPSVSSQLQRQQSMQRCIEALIHAVNCRNANCFSRNCFQYKRVIVHTKECKGKNNQCTVCKQMIFLCWYHAKTCVDPNCQVPFCTNLKSKIQKQRATSLQTDRRRMQAMMEQRSEVKVPIHSSTTGHSNAFRSDTPQGVSYESTSMANASGKSAVRLVSSSQTLNRSNTPSSNTNYIVAQKPNNEKLATYHSLSTGPNSLTATVARVKQDPSIEEAQLADQNEQKQTMFSPLINKALVTRVPSNTFNPLQAQGQAQTHTQPQQQQWYGANTAQNYAQSATHGMTTRPRYPSVSQQNPSVLQTLIAPTRATLSPSGYSNRPTLTRPPSTLNQPRPPPPQSQDPNHR